MTTSPANTQQIALLHHTLGLRVDQRTPYRNHFVASDGHHDIADLEALERLGLMGRAHTPAFCHPSDIVFCTTDAGRALALEMLPEPPKLTRYREYLACDAQESFGEYLVKNLPKFETEFEYRKVGMRWRYVYRHRMYRAIYSGYGYELYRDVQGDWASTKKEAKASYKAALAKKRAAAKQPMRPPTCAINPHPPQPANERVVFIGATAA